MEQNDIYVIYGLTPKKMVMDLLQQARIERDIDKNTRIGLKPNLVVAKPSTSGATTTPGLVEGVIEYLQSHGYRNISILEGSWVGDKTSTAFKVCGYEEIAKKFNVPLVDTQKDSYRAYKAGKYNINVCNSVMGIDYLINMPVLKGHCQTQMTCALKNLKGCIPNSEKRKFHTWGLHEPIAYLNKIIKQNLIIVDALMGDLNFEEGGNPVQMDRVFLGQDPVLIDSYAAGLLGFVASGIDYISMANQIGVGEMDLSKANVVELNKADINKPVFVNQGVAGTLAQYIEENNACSACYASLIHALDRMKGTGHLKRFKGKISVGQGFKGVSQEGIGCGNCTKGFTSHIPGCPPKGIDILSYLKKGLID